MDDVDFIVITSKNGNNTGQFIFPTSVLANKGIISQNGKDEKRGIRVYPNWDIVRNKQAEKTQNWQRKYFVTIGSDNSAELDLTQKIFDKIYENG
ncbi:MepB family protein [Aquirufa beregesia]|uniref:MepB family protein n=1 Tax=Aquirufa beregesia TaxID=2516556 RepID=UPI001F1765DD|nr:MepB family protein [Aquirufa beregesia]